MSSAILLLALVVLVSSSIIVSPHLLQQEQEILVKDQNETVNKRTIPQEKNQFLSEKACKPVDDDNLGQNQQDSFSFNSQSKQVDDSNRLADITRGKELISHPNNGENQINLIANGDFQAVQVINHGINSSLTHWLMNDSYIVKGSLVTPQWASRIALLGLECSSQVKFSEGNRKYNMIEQSFTLNASYSLKLTISYGLVSTQNTVKQMSISSNSLLWITFNNKLTSFTVYPRIDVSNIALLGINGTNTLYLHGLRAGFDCIGSEMIAIDNITLTYA